MRFLLMKVLYCIAFQMYSKIYLRRGRNRHAYLRKKLGHVKIINDFFDSYVSEIGTFLCQTFPNLRRDQKIKIKPEVTISNRRPDFVFLIPNVALIVLEYKTSNTTLNIRSSYIKQMADTYKKFRLKLLDHEEHGKTNNNVIDFMSILLIRNASTMENKLKCLFRRKIPNIKIWIWMFIIPQISDSPSH